MLEKIEKLKKWWVIIIGVLSLLISAFMFCHNLLNKNDEILEMVKSNQQMTLKNTIWNENIPIQERVAACDVYLGLGYNSYTKKECEIIIEISASNGAFNIERNDFK